MKIATSKILPNPEQPRLNIDLEELRSLSESILEHGLINPIAVEQAGDSYILIDGERRWRASMLAGLTEIEASIRPGLNGNGQAERMILATVANIQRSDLNPLEKALSYQKLIGMGMNLAEVAKTVGCHVATIYNYLLILRLPENARQLVAAGKLATDPNALRAIMELDQPTMEAVIRAASNRSLTGQQIQTLARRMKSGKRVSAVRNAKVKAELSPTWVGKWSMIAQAGNPHICEEWRVAAMETCFACALYEDASPKICKDCPGVEFLRRLVCLHANSEGK